MADSQNVIQPNLFDFSESTTAVIELFPAVWTGLEQLTSPDVDERRAGIDQLIALDAHRFSPLVAYVFATCIADPNIELRYKVVQALGEVLSHNSHFQISPENVRQRVKTYLSQMRRRRVYALLQVAEFHPSSETNVALILKTCSHAGRTLSDIFQDRRIPVELRRQAIHFSGIVGFLDAVPGLEKLGERLGSRVSGQRSMSFAPPSDLNESTLLPAVQTALAILNAP